MSACDQLWVEAETGRIYPMTPTRDTPDGRRQKLNGVTNALICVLPVVHTEEITWENADETFIRIRMLELAGAPLLLQSSVPGEIQLIALEDVCRHVGLRVGAGIALRPFEETLVADLRRRASEALATAKNAAPTDISKSTATN